VSDEAVTAAQETDEPIVLSIPPMTAGETNAPAIEVNVPASAGEAKVEIPIEKLTPGTVAVIVKVDGTEELVKTSISTENSEVLSVEGTATVKIVDNAKEFVDVRTGHWGENALAFGAARGTPPPLKSIPAVKSRSKNTPSNFQTNVRVISGAS